MLTVDMQLMFLHAHTVSTREAALFIQVGACACSEPVQHPALLHHSTAVVWLAHVHACRPLVTLSFQPL